MEHDGLPEFWELIDGDGLPEFHALLEEDMDYHHAQALIDYSFPVLMEAMFMKPPLSDTDIVAAILRYEGSAGLRWAA